MTNRSWITIGAGALALAIVCALAWWAYTEAQKRALQQQAIALVQDSTARLREALGLLTAGPDARPTLEAHFAALEDDVKKTQALDNSTYPALVEAANGYVTDVHALLRRELALYAGRDAVHLDIAAIHGHLSAAGTRSPAWISQALALQQRLDRSFLDYRLAAGGLEKSLASLRDTGLALRDFVPAAAVIEAGELSSAEKQLAVLSAQIEPEVESGRKLPPG